MASPLGSVPQHVQSHPPVNCHVQVNVFPVCPHDPPHLLDVNQQRKFREVLQPAVKDSVDKLTAPNKGSSAVITPPISPPKNQTNNPDVRSVATQTSPIPLISTAQAALFQPLYCETDLPPALPSPVAASTPRSEYQWPILSRLLTQPEWAYLRDMEPVTPPISPVEPNHVTSPMLHDVDPVLSYTSLPDQDGETNEWSVVSITSGPDTDRGVKQDDGEMSLITPPCLQDTTTFTSQLSQLTELTPEEVVDSLCELSGNYQEHALDLTDLEPLFDFS